MISSRFFSHTIGIHKTIGISDQSHQTNRISVLSFGLPTKTSNKIAGETNIGPESTANLIDQIQVDLPCISAPHSLQTRARAGLSGQVNAFADVCPLLHQLDELVGKVFGMR